MAQKALDKTTEARMTAQVTIPAGESGVLRLFTLESVEAGFATFVRDPAAPTEAELARLLGLAKVPAQTVDLIRLADVTALGLRGFLIEGHDVLPEVLGDAYAWLDDLTGFVLIVHPSIAATLPVQINRLPPGVAYVGAFALGTPNPAPLSLPEAERLAILSGPPAKRLAKGTGMAALLVILAVLVGLALLLLRGVS
jgi:hypothetical protein